MPETTSPGISKDDLLAYLGSVGLGDVGTFTIATLPDPNAWSRRTAWALDLFSDLPTPGGRLVSEGGFWKPVRPLALAKPVSANMTLTALMNSPTQIVGGAIGAGITHTISFSLAGAYPGARFRTKRLATGGLGSVLSISGTLLPLNNWVDHEFDGSAWVETASGGLL